MLNNLKELKLEQVCKRIYRYPSFYGMNKFSEGIPVVRGEHLLNSGRISSDWDDYWFVTEEYANKYPNTRLELYDVVMSVRGTVGQFAMVGPEHIGAQISPNTIRISPDPNKICPKFLYYALKSDIAISFLAGCVSSSAVPALRATDIKLTPIILPSITEQRTIATILGAMDDKIDLNRKMNKTLEEMAQATFKNWFIDFEPFRGQGMQNSPLGEIPVGWQVEKLETIAEFTKGLSYRSDELQESETALVTLKSIARGGGYQQEGLKPFIGDYKAEQQIAPGEVVLAHTDLTQAAEVLGRAARVQPNPKYDNLVASLDLVIVRPKEQKATNVFLYSLLSQRQYVEHALGYANGTTVLHLSKNALPEYEFILPPSPIIEKYSELVEPIFKQIDLNENQSNLLFKIRDTLLPKLVSGEIRVKETDKFVEEVA